MKRIALTTALLVLWGQTMLVAQENRPPGRTTDTAQARSTGETVGIDRAAAIGHALCMAIEGSELWCSAQKSTSAPEPRTTAAPATRQAGDITAALQKHASHSFQESTRLFDAVESDKASESAQAAASKSSSQACQAFFDAARDYSRALHARCGTQPGAEGRATTTLITGPGTDWSTVILLNHAVKEAVGGVGLRQMIKHHNDGSDVSSALAAHAQTMLQSSREALASASGGGAAPATRRESARPAFGEPAKPQAGRGDPAQRQPTAPARDPQAPRAPGAVTDPQTPRTPGAVTDARPIEGAGSQDLVMLARAVIDAAEQLDMEQSAPTPRASRLPAPRTSDTPAPRTPASPSPRTPATPAPRDDR